MVSKRLAALYHVAALAFLAVATSCSPSSPSPRPVALHIEPATAALRLGDELVFRAVVERADGSRNEAVGAWSTAGVSVAVVAGRTTGLSIGVDEIRVSAEGLSAARPINVVPDMRGTWTGTLQHPTCNRYVGEGPSICGKLADGMQYQFDAIVTVHNGAGAAMDVTISRKAVGRINATVHGVDGLSLDDAVAVMDGGIFRFKAWSGVVGPQHIDVSGRLEREFTNAWGAQHYWMDATIRLTKAESQP
jgi:hypothetical protein